MDFVATFQGSLVKFKPINYDQQEQKNPLSKRGAVKEFSRKSRGRMLELAATIRDDLDCDFITLTYADCIVPHDTITLQRHLKAFLERLRRLAPKSSAIWRIEVVERKSGVFKGYAVPHIHLIVFGTKKITLPEFRHDYSGWVYDSWKSITNYEEIADLHGISDLLRTDHERLFSKRGLLYYVSKYAAKIEETESPLVYLPYSHGGRFWGVFNRSFIPYAKKIEIVVEHASQAFYAIRRGAAKHWKGLSRKTHGMGFKIFCNNASRWLNFTYDALLRYTEDEPLHLTRKQRIFNTRRQLKGLYNAQKNRRNNAPRVSTSYVLYNSEIYTPYEKSIPRFT